MEQLSMEYMTNDTSVIANRYYSEILELLEEKQMGYDLTVIRIEHREPPKADPYDAILFFSKTCFHIKGKKTKYLYFSPAVEKIMEKHGVSFAPATISHWARIPVGEFDGFISLSALVEEIYEECLRASDNFGCCGSYMECSDAGQCIKKEIMFAGRCLYRQNLKAGRIFYGVNKNI